MEAESAGAKGAFRRFSEVSSTTTSTVFRGLAILGAVRDRLTESGLQSRVKLQVGVRRTNKAIYSLTPGKGVLGDPMFWEHLGGALGPRF